MPLLLDRKDSIETEDFKTGTYLIILVYSVFHNLVIQNMTLIQIRDNISHFSYSILSYEEYLVNFQIPSLYHSFLMPLFFDQVTKNPTYTTTSLTSAWQKAKARNTLCT